MDYSIAITLGFLVFAIVMFALEKIPLSITAMIVAVGLHLSGVLTATEALKVSLTLMLFCLSLCLLSALLSLKQV